MGKAKVLIRYRCSYCTVGLPLRGTSPGGLVASKEAAIYHGFWPSRARGLHGSSSAALRNSRGSLVGIGAFVAARVDCGRHIEVRGPGLNGGVVVARAADKRWVQYGVAAAVHRAAIDVVPGHGRSTRGPTQRHGGWRVRRRREVDAGGVRPAERDALIRWRERETRVAWGYRVASVGQSCEGVSARCVGCGGRARRSAQQHGRAASARGQGDRARNREGG